MATDMKRLDSGGDEVVSIPQLPRDVIYTILMLAFQKKAFVTGEEEYRRLISFILLNKKMGLTLPKKVLGMNCGGGGDIEGSYDEGLVQQCTNITSMTISSFFKVGIVLLLKCMKHLVKLDTYYALTNEVIKTLPPTLTKLTVRGFSDLNTHHPTLSNLTSLKISPSGRLSPIIFNPFVLLFPKLKKLDCLISLHYSSLRLLTSLESLRIKSVNVELSTLTNLTILKQYETDIIHDFHNDLPYLTKLVKLSLTWTNTVNKNDLKNLHNIKVLYLKGYWVKDLTLSHVTTIEKLKLYSTTVSGVCFTNFCATLTTLIIKNTPVLGEYLHVLTQLKHLSISRIGNGMTSLSRLTTLQTLRVGKNITIRDRDVTTLTNLTHLSVYNQDVIQDILSFLPSLITITLRDKIPPHITVKK
jgi:hypothetical protein